MTENEFLDAVLRMNGAKMKTKFEERNVMGENYIAVVFADTFPCRVLSYENGVLTVEHSAISASPYDAIHAMCNCFDELKEKYGVREIKIALNREELTITAENSKNPKTIFFYWLRHLA